ncbi:hypothetical protein B0T14DRAFT_518290 [Immersiella caudata]|uniref:Uncharacterized protein n=1 Tax=Immersiella caudata TaxID=314043 RepID=A0AA40BZA3_9PEZI|nr:hypothetical protein B0T14DRAFT_518290 [Immersiella caudata]
MKICLPCADLLCSATPTVTSLSYFLYPLYRGFIRDNILNSVLAVLFGIRRFVSMTC